MEDMETGNGFDDYWKRNSEFERYARETSGKKDAEHIDEAVRFAHPMDAGVIKILNNKMVNSLFERYVDASVDVQSGLVLSTGFKVDGESKPELYQILVECSEILNISVPYAVVSNSISGVNAQTSGTDHFAYIAISSLLDTLFTNEEKRFVLGHECGHIALGHVVYHTVMQTVGELGSFIPIVGSLLARTIEFPMNYWSRRSEISADRAGLLCCGDLNTAERTLVKLEAGFMKIDDIDINDYLENYRRFQSRNSLGKYTEIFHSHPVIPKRIEALELYANSENYYRMLGKEVPAGVSLLSDKELNERIEKIIRVLV